MPPEPTDQAERQALAGRLPHDTDEFRQQVKQQAVRSAWCHPENRLTVHSFTTSGIGADWTLESLLSRIDDAGRVEWVTSELPGALRHPLAVTDEKGYTLLFEVAQPKPDPEPPAPPNPEAWELAVALTETAYLLLEVWRADKTEPDWWRPYGERVAAAVERWAVHPSHLAEPGPADVAPTLDEDPRDSRGHRIREAIYTALTAESGFTDKPGVRASYLAQAVLDIANGTGLDRVVAALPADSHISDAATLLTALEDGDYLRVRGNADGRVEVWARG